MGLKMHGAMQVRTAAGWSGPIIGMRCVFQFMQRPPAERTDADCQPQGNSQTGAIYGYKCRHNGIR